MTKKRKPNRQLAARLQRQLTSVVLTPDQTKVVRSLARDRQRTVDEANRMLAEAEAAFQELARTYATLYGLECEEGGRFDFEPVGDQIILKAFPPAPEGETPPVPPAPEGDPGSSPPESPPADSGAGGPLAPRGAEGVGGEKGPPAEAPPE